MAELAMEAGAPDVAAQVVEEQEVYVGPRPFERKDRSLFFGRDREISELLSLVISSRVVLCYAPSGAGKTSLINAGLRPRLEQEGFDVLPSARVRGMVPEGIDQKQISNLYMFNALLSLSGKEGEPAGLVDCTLAKFLSVRPFIDDEEGFQAARILTFDQFEELLSSYPERWQERQVFFQQVRDALQADPLLRVLFVMREDFLARSEPYLQLLKPFSQARFRLPLLGPEGAHAAITGPLRETNRRFKEGVAEALIQELLKVRVETAQGEAVEVEGEYVEPVQLQVVCSNLWTRLPAEVLEINLEHLETYGDVDQALQGFYESCITLAKTSQGADEIRLRQWFEEQLITPAGTRGIVFRDARHTAGLPNPVVEFLENRHLIRGEWRAGSRWYELTHDRFIEPIQGANRLWRARRQARRNRWILAAFVPLLLVMVISAGYFGAKGVNPQAADAVATAKVEVQSTAQVEVQVVREDLAVSRSKQLALQAPLVDSGDLALLLAVEANRQADTEEARRSLHKILSRQPGIDEGFLRELSPEIVSPRMARRLEGHEDWVQSVAFSPDGKQIVSGSRDLKLRVWDVSTGELVGSPLLGHESEVWSVAYSPAGDLIASAGIDGQILLWDAAKKELIGAPLLSQSAWITSLAFSPDGKRLAAGDGNGVLRVWNLSTRELLPVPEAHKETIWSVAWSPDGQYLASGSMDGTIGLWNTTSFEVHFLIGHSGPVRTLAWSPDSRELASGSAVETGRFSGGEVLLWEAESGRVIARPLPDVNQSIRAVAFDPTGKTLAIGRINGTINFWDVRSEQILGGLMGHDKPVMALAFSPDGRYFVSGSMDKTLVLWELFPATRSIAFSPSGEFLAASQGANISLWNLANKDAPVSVLSGHTDEVSSLAFSPDGSLLASTADADGIFLWDLKKQPVGPPLVGSGDAIHFDFSPDGKQLVSVSQNGTALLWDVENFQAKGPEPAYQDDALVEALFDPGGKALYLICRDGRLITLDLASYTEQAQTLIGTQGGEMLSFAISPDGQKLAFYQEVGSAFVQDDRRAHGITISQWDQSFDPSVKREDLDFVIVLATNGLQVDSKFKEYLEPIQAIPIRGAIHVFQPGQPWQEQADLFLSVVKDKGFHFFAIDVEIEPKENGVIFAEEVERWLRYVAERVGQKVLLQVNPYFYNDWLAPSGEWMKEWPLLIMTYAYAQFEGVEPERNGSPVLPAGVTDWKIWNYTEQGVGYGVGSDYALLNVYNGTALEMWHWLEIPAFSIYHRPSGQLIRPNLSIQAPGPSSIVFSLDGSYVAAGGGNTVSLMAATSGEEHSALTLGSRVITSLGFQPNGRALAVGTDAGRVFLWDLSLLDTELDNKQTIDVACSLLSRNFTENEWMQYLGNEPYHKTCENLP